MKKIFLTTLALPIFLAAHDNSDVVYCNKLSLPIDKINSSHYKDCVQPTVKYTEDEIIAYRIPGDQCTPRKLQAKKNAIKRLKEQGNWTENSNFSETEKLAYSVPDYETWSTHEIERYKEAVKIVQQQNNDR